MSIGVVSVFFCLEAVEDGKDILLVDLVVCSCCELPLVGGVGKSASIFG